MDHTKDALDSLPIYVTSSIFRIPSEDPNNMDAKVFQSEVKVLRSELHDLRKNMDEKFKRLPMEIIEQVKVVQTQEEKVVHEKTVYETVNENNYSVAKACQDFENASKCQDVERPTKNETIKPLTIDKEDNQKVFGFFGYMSPLSNFYSCRVSMPDKEFASSEHAFQCMKAEYCGRIAMMSSISMAPSAREAKKLGDSIPIPIHLQKAWPKVAAEKMEQICTRKFQQNPGASEFLLKTGDRILAEASRDRLWGCGYMIPDSRVTDTATWIGKNLLGQVLMRVRNKIRSGSLGSNEDNNEDQVFFDLPVYTLDCPGNESQKESSSVSGWISEKPITFADTVKKPGEWKLVHCLKKKQIHKTQGNNVDNKGLTGVKKITLADFYIGQLQKETSATDVMTYVDSQGIKAVSCFPLTSKVHNSTAFRLRCNVSHKDKLLDGNFWPSDVVIREWVRKPHQPFIQ